MAALRSVLARGTVVLLLLAPFSLVEAAFRVSEEPPEGFRSLTEKQTTEADVYFGGLLLTTVFVEYDLYEIEVLDPAAVVERIPNVRHADKLVQHLTGPRPTNAEHICSLRTRVECGKLRPQVLDLIFDDSRFRLDLFVNRNELALHALEQERYLPDSAVDRSWLHNLRSSLSGTGSDRRYNLSSESFFSMGESRLRGRYALSNDGFTLYEMSWQQDDRDVEYEYGSFRTLGRNSAFANDFDVLGVRMASSTKRRLDLDSALGTPVYLFLDERSRVDVYRGSELVHSRYYEAGNRQIDSSGFPDGAYDVTLKISGHSGEEKEEIQFFVKSGMMPPKGEPQYFVEAGTLVDTSQPGLPDVLGEYWMRGGTSHRVRDDLALDGEFFYAGSHGVIQGGLFTLQRNWHMYSGAMLSDRGDKGFSIRAGLHLGEVSANIDYRQVTAREQEVAQAFSLFQRSFRQGTLTLAFPMLGGRFFVRGRLNDRSANNEKSLGFSYWAPLFQSRGLTGNLSLDGNYSSEQSWIQLGLRLRWQRRGESATFNPAFRHFEDGQDTGFDMLANGRWNGLSDFGRLGQTDRSVFVNHTPERSNLGARFVPREYPMSDVEVGIQRNLQATDYYYAMNNQTTVVTRNGNTSWGDGGRGAGALMVRINGPITGKFEVVVDDRVAGYAWAGTPTVISLPPYETYRVRIRPLGDRIVGVDERVHQLTLYPGNVETLEFTARELTVLVGQAVYVDGTPVASARFENVEGYGSTDELGWFQVELAHRDPLVLTPRAGATCRIQLPELYVEQGLAVVDQLVCEDQGLTTQAQQ